MALDYVDVAKGTQDKMGGLLKPIYLAPKSWFAASGGLKVVAVKPPATYTTVADATALGALTPSAGDYAYQTDITEYLYYTGTAWITYTEVEILGTHTFESGKGFIIVNSVIDTGKLMGELIGSQDAFGKKLTVEFLFPGITEAAAEFDRFAKNEDWVALVKTPNGQTLQLGTDGLECTVTSTFDSGTISSGNNGFTFKLESFGNNITFYKGAITLKP